ncbi:MAG TPA: MFS transporter [Actinomycetota bacterium]|nr:MFS transporter [Actinomycetota bacterium]
MGREGDRRAGAVERVEGEPEAIGAGSQPPRWREVFRGARGRLTAGLLLLEALVAIQILVVATVMPAVRRDLGDIQFYGWTFSAAGLGQFAAIPIAGRAMDRFGSRRLLAATLALYTTGLLLAAFAPSMLALVGARLIQGIGGGSTYAVSLGTVAKTYPEDVRPRVLALLAAMWILPGLLGPPLGAALAATLGWRWAFVAPIPVLALSAVLVFPALPAGLGDRGARISLGPPLVLAAGAGAFLAGLTDLSVWSIPLVVVGLAVALPALQRIVPPGTLLARRGMPAAAAAAFLLSMSFVSADAFLTLMLTAVNGRTIGEAGLVITFVTIAWSVGSWWQSRVAASRDPGGLVILGSVLVMVGTLAAAAGLIHWPLALPYAGWTVAGIGMGIAFPTIPLSVMNASTAGEEAGELSPVLLMDTLGVAVGAGLGGACVALAKTSGVGLRAGIGGAFAIGSLAAVVLAAVAPRLPTGRPPASTDAHESGTD